MKHFVLVISILALYHTAFTQFIFTPKKPVETLQQTIDKYELIQLKDPLPFSYIRIIDSRYDTSIIGFFLDKYLTLRDSTQPVALQHVVDKYYHSLCTPGKDTLLIQLEKLSIQDKIFDDDTTDISTIGNVRCKVYGGSNNKYKFPADADTLMCEKFDYYMGHKNGKHFNADYWDFYLLRLLEYAITNAKPAIDATTDSTVCSIEEIKVQGLQKRNKPILTADTLRPGFYRNFAEFENNDPGFTYINDTALYKLLEIMNYRVGKKISQEAPDTSYRGFCNGKKLFIRYRYDFYQLERKDGAFYISPTLDARRKEVNRTGWNMLIGLATLTTSIAAKEGADFRGFDMLEPPNMPMVVLQMNQGSALGLQLDWDTGKIMY